MHENYRTQNETQRVRPRYVRLQTASPKKASSNTRLVPPVAPFIHPETQSCERRKALHAREAAKP